MWSYSRIVWFVVAFGSVPLLHAEEQQLSPVEQQLAPLVSKAIDEGIEPSTVLAIASKAYITVTAELCGERYVTADMRDLSLRSVEKKINIPAAIANGHFDGMTDRLRKYFSSDNQALITECQSY